MATIATGRPAWPFELRRRIAAVDPQHGGQQHRFGIARLAPQDPGQLVEILLPVEDAGDIGRTHLAGIVADRFERRHVERAHRALRPHAAESLGEELRIEIEEALGIEQHRLAPRQRIGRFAAHIPRQRQPRGFQPAHRREPVVVTGCIALDGDARLREQCGGLGRQRPETFGADAGVRVFGSLPDRLGHRLRGSGHGRTVGQRAQQIERPRREVQRALPRRDDGAAPPAFERRMPQTSPARPPPMITLSNFISSFRIVSTR